MRIGGLASGMDTDSMIKQIMKAENMKVDRVKADKQVMEWKQQLYNELNKDFANFILKSKDDLGYKNGRSTNMEMGLKISSSDEKIATVSSGGNKVAGTHSIEVKRLAEGVKGNGDLSVDINSKTKLGVMNININGADIKISADDTMKEFVDKINSAKKKVVGEDGEITEVPISVKASYDEANNKFFIQTTGVGKESEINITADTNGSTFINEKVKLKLSTYSAEGVQSFVDAGVSSTSNPFKGIDAKITYNGLDMDQSSNNFQLNGMSIGLKDVGKVNVTISKDNDEAVKKVKDFINEYNNMIDKVSGLLGEKVNRGFKPLTDEQKEALSDKEAELWQGKAKSGLLRNDDYVGKVLTQMRVDIYKNVEGTTGAFNHITQVGITTQEYKGGTAGGKLQINEEKLRKALDQDFDGVMDLLFKEDPNNAIKDDSKLSPKDLADKRNNSGIATRIFDNMIIGIKDIVAKSGTGADGELFRKVRSTILVDFTTRGGHNSGRGSISDIDSELFKFDKRIDDLSALLFKRENAHYAKFTAMEKAMQQMSTQSGWLGQQTGGM